MKQSDITGVSSWGGLYTDIKGSRDWAIGCVPTWAAQLGWSAAVQAAVSQDIEDAYQEADSAAWFGFDPDTFWQSLADASTTWPNGDMLAPVFASAGATVDSQDELTYDWEGYGDDMIADASAGIETLEDVADSGAKALKMPAVWGIGAGIAALGLASYLLL